MKVTHNEEDSQFEMKVDGSKAVAGYRLSPGQITFTHTNVPSELEGRGIGGQLARAGLEHARAEGLNVVAECSFIAAYIKRHPEFQDLVKE